MSQNYITIFREIANTVGALTEKAQATDDTQMANLLKEDFFQLYTRLSKKDCTIDQLEYKDYVKLLLGILIVIKTLENRIDDEEKALANYRDDIMPALQQIVDDDNKNTKTLAQELFN